MLLIASIPRFGITFCNFVTTILDDDDEIDGDVLCLVKEMEIEPRGDIASEVCYSQNACQVI